MSQQSDHKIKTRKLFFYENVTKSNNQCANGDSVQKRLINSFDDHASES